MIISDIYKYIYIAIPKTGTRSIYHILRKYYEGQLHNDHGTIIPITKRAYFTFTSIRNPYDRACSAYCSTCDIKTDQYRYKRIFKEQGLPNTFKSYLTLLSKGQGMIDTSYPQQRWFNNNRIDYIIRMEKFEDDIRCLPFIDHDIEIPKLNIGSKKDPPSMKSEDMLTDITISLINSIYKADFNLGYPIVNNLNEFINKYY